MPKKLQLLALAGLSAACHQGVKTDNKEEQKPNIIFIMTDDHAYQALSAYGGPLAGIAPTPNLDRIADAGMRFDRCLVTNSISGPSRACILTGKYSHENGFIANEADPFDGSQQTFPKLLQKAGYQTAIIGKWHLDSDPTGFDHWEILKAQGHYYNPDFITAEGMHRDTGYVTELITDKTLEWLEEAGKTKKPFMLMMHHKAPHRTWQPLPEDIEKFENLEFPEPQTLFDDYSGRGTAEHDAEMSILEDMRMGVDLKILSKAEADKELARMTPEQREAWDVSYKDIIAGSPGANMSDEDLLKWKYQRYMQDYLACIASVDRSVGELLDYLKEKGLAKNTIIVYTSDQGFYLGEHGWFDKRFMFEESYRTPLLISWPGKTKPGSINTDIVSNLDFAESFLDAAGITVPDDMQGESLVPILKGNTPEDWRQSHYYHYYGYPDWHSVKRHYGISTDRYKLIHYYHDIDEWELFDIEADPLEMKNVYDDPAYASEKERLHHQLDSIMRYYGDSDSLAISYIK